MRRIPLLRASSILIACATICSGSTATARPFGFNEIEVILTGPGGKKLAYPEGVACRGDGDLIVADTGNRRLLRFRYQNGSLAGSAMPALRAGIRPTRVEFDKQGNIFVLDGSGQRRIVRLDAKGRFVDFVELKGSPLVKDIVVGSFKIDADGNFYVLNLTVPNVLVADAKGKFKRAIALPKEERVYSDLAVTSSGKVFVLTGATARIYQAKPNAKSVSLLSKTLDRFMSYGSHLSLDELEANLYVVDQHGDRVLLVSADGRYIGRKFARGWSKGYLHFPAQTCATKKGDLLVADRDNNRVQFFTVR